MEEVFKKAHAVIDKPGCRSCKTNKQKRLIYKALLVEIQKQPDIDVSFLEFIQNELNIFKPLIEAASIEDSIPREVCIECVGKHLAQAYILMKEMQQGYPDHLEYAEAHIKKAIDQAPKDRIQELEKIVNALEKVDIDELPKTVQHLETVRSLIETTLETLDDVLGLTRWIIIGHLAEASDECLKYNEQFANDIRKERLSLMDDPDYDIPIKYLLNKAKALISHESK